MNCELLDKVFAVSPDRFEHIALEIFRFQHDQNRVYRQFCEALHISPSSVKSLGDIPFMPVSFFKNHEVVSGSFTPEAVFESSGTTATGNSKHLVKSLDLYRQSFLHGFELFYGPVSEWCILALLPSYLERQNSSLVLMMDELIRASGHPESGFYLYDHIRLVDTVKKNEQAGKKTLLMGVTFALLDLAEEFATPLRHTVVMETGGMKGRRKEITREEVHKVLQQAWGLSEIHSEYGMSELLSQAYSRGRGLFECPPWLRIVLRDEDDPLTLKPLMGQLQSGLINVVDLANIYSCSFIATDDLGKQHADGSFEVIGRMDSSDVRGCSLMYTV